MFDKDFLHNVHAKIINNSDIIDECLIYQPKSLHSSYKGIYYNAHKIVWLFYNQEQDQNLTTVSHSCNNKKCVNINHMHYSSYKLHSKDGILERISKNAIKKGDCLVANFAPHPVTGYGKVYVNGKNYALHRTVYWISSDIDNIDDIPNDADQGFVRHLCREKLCIKPDHYTIGSIIDNHHDKIRDDTLLMGDNHPNAIITLEVAQKIADSWKTRGTDGYLSQAERALLFEVPIYTVVCIDSRQSWKEVVHPNGKSYFTYKKRKRVDGLLLKDDDWDEILRRLKKKSVRVKQSNVYCGSPCWEQAAWRSDRHPATLSYMGRSKTAYIWACEYSVRRFIADGESTRHLCGNGPICMNPGHLIFGSAKDQARDHRTHETSGSKLTITQARAIRKDVRPYKDIARQYGISEPHVSNVMSGKAWKENDE